MIEEALVRIQEHEKGCMIFRRTMWSLVIIAATVLGSMAMQILLLTGRIEGLTRAIEEHSDRIVAVSSANVAREQRLQNEIDRLRDRLDNQTKDR